MRVLNMVLRVCTTMYMYMYMEPHPRISKMYCKVLFGSQEYVCRDFHHQV